MLIMRIGIKQTAVKLQVTLKGRIYCVT